jgi:hypothetical protein
MLANPVVATVAAVRTTRRRAATGALGASVLLVMATACSSGSDEPTSESLPTAPIETTIGATEAADAPGTDATTAAPSPDGTSTDAGGPATSDAAVVVPEALQFTAPLVGGGTFDGAAVAGKPTVFWFWAPT